MPVARRRCGGKYVAEKRERILKIGRIHHGRQTPLALIGEASGTLSPILGAAESG